MDLGIAGKLAVITGGSRGLGASIARNLAEAGARIAFCARKEDDVAALLQELEMSGVRHYGKAIDLETSQGVQKFAEWVESEAGVPDIIVHNVGGNLGITDPLCHIEDWRRVWHLNLEVAIALNNRWLPEMRKKKWGRITHISSISALENHGPITYCSVKAALCSYARGLGRIVAPDGVIVTSVLPGAVFTEGGYWDDTKRNRPDHYEKFLKERMAINRFGHPDEIGAVVAFVCSKHSSFMVGSIVPVDGGQGRTFYQWENT